MTVTGNAASTSLRWRSWRDDCGSAGIEFALIAPIFLLILASIFEIGLVIRAKFAVISVVSAAANQSLLIGDTVSDGSADAIAVSLAALLAGEGRSGTVNINNAVTAELDAGQVMVTGTGGEIAGCYCAARQDGQMAWGPAVECSIPCSEGDQSGRFVVITAEAPFDLSVGIYGFFTDDVIRETAVVRLP